MEILRQGGVDEDFLGKHPLLLGNVHQCQALTDFNAGRSINVQAIISVEEEVLKLTAAFPVLALQSDVKAAKGAQNIACSWGLLSLHGDDNLADGFIPESCVVGSHGC
jgi:hypothetical protein